ncbi:MAG: DUF1152 domain-containing protein [Archaeoglobales archaeon]|nr:DUF1152 domain-containing protein [Archaeoglobales archaeon]
MEILKLLKSCSKKKAFVFGVGGGGDVVSTIPVANFLKLFDFDVIHGCVLWDRLVVDPKPGPRSLEELENLEPINNVLAYIYEDTKTYYGVKPNLARSSKHFGKVVALDITKGVRELVKGIKEFIDETDIGLIVGVDAGGDALATGYESGVRSPLADAISVAVLKNIDGILAVLGFGSDGELKTEELLLNISEIIKIGGYLGCTSISYEDYREMMKVADFVVTEASYIPLMSFEGFFGIKKLRKGRTSIISPLSTLIFYFRASKVFEINEAAKIVERARNIREANELLHRAGITTELDFEELTKPDL